jgi:hypothetical protein
MKPKTTNIEVKFFGMIVLAWALIAIVFNVANREVSAAKKPAAVKTVAHHRAVPKKHAKKAPKNVVAAGSRINRAKM